MASCIDSFDDIYFINRELQKAKKEDGYNLCGLISAISIVFAVYSFLVFSCQILIKNTIGDIVWLQTAYNHLFFMKGFEYISVAFSILYYLIFHTIEIKRIEKYHIQFSKLNSELKNCWAEIHEHYLKFNNPPLSYTYCNPNVLNIIIQELEDDENCTLRQALFQIDKKCHSEYE